MDYAQVLQVCEEKGITFSRWYAIDSLFYMCFDNSDCQRHIDKVRSVFQDADVLRQYNQIAIDMDHYRVKNDKPVYESNKRRAKNNDEEFTLD